jgi:hypothetical protein
MPVSLRLTSTVDADNPVEGDFHLVNGSYEVIGDTAETFKDAVAQKIQNRLLFFKGEYFLDQREGTPWFESILVKSPDLGAIRSILRDVIAGTDGVAGVERVELDFNRSARTLAISFAAQLTDGTLLEQDLPFIVER